MKVTCPRDALLAALQHAQLAVATRTTRPVLACVKLTAADDVLTLTGTDMEVGIARTLPGVTVARSGAAIVPPGRLVSILRETGDLDITLDADAETTRIKLSTGRFELPGGDPDEFPDVPTFDAGGRHHEITAGVLRTLIKRTAFAAERKESTRWAVTGVLWEADQGKARLVATDTKRLAMTEGPAEVHGEPEAKAASHLIPLKAVGILERNLADDGEVIRVALKPNEAMFQTERALIHTKLVEGRFPPYRDIVPKRFAVKLTLDRAELHARVRQAAIMAEGDSSRVDFRFDPATATITLAARGVDAGQSEVTMAIPGYDGPAIDLSIDPRYLGEYLKAVDAEPTVTWEMNAGDKPVILRAGDDSACLIMPMSA